METVLGWVSSYGAISLFFLLMLGIVGLPVPDETLLVFSGYLIYSGRLDPVFTVVCAALGSMTGISVSYWLGRTFGYKVIHKYGPRFHLTEERLARVHNWFERIGRWTLFVGYYIPGVRHFTAVVAGASELEPHVFARFAYSGAAVWVGTFLSLGYFLGDRWNRAWEDIHAHLHEAAAVAVAVVALAALTRWLNRRAAP